METSPELSVVGVFVGRATRLAERRGRPVMSAIRKAPVPDAQLWLAHENLRGDEQADLSVHGGPDKAVYAYPMEHRPRWADDGFDLPPGAVGENVATHGADEHEVRIGDVWQWGDAVVQVTQPRAPCFKLSLHQNRQDIGSAMIRTQRTGWYLRVLRPGVVPTSGVLAPTERSATEPTVAEAFSVLFSRQPDTGLVRRVAASRALATQWRAALIERHGSPSR